MVWINTNGIFLIFPADYDMSCGICVCIPGYEMRGAGSAAHWEYEVSWFNNSQSPSETFYIDKVKFVHHNSSACVFLSPNFQKKFSLNVSLQVKIAAGNESWTVFRRYRRFRELHMYMCHKYGQLVSQHTAHFQLCIVI